MATANEKTKMIAGEEYLSASAAAEFLGCCRSTLDLMMAKSAHGTLRPALEWLRYRPRGPVWFRKAFLEDWVERRGKVRV